MPDQKYDFLTKKLGPLPTWVWIGAGGLGLGLFLRYRSSKKQAASVAASQAPTSAVGTGGSIDPTTGMPYAEEYGAYPSYATGPYSGVAGGSISGPLGYYSNPINAPIPSTTTSTAPPTSFVDTIGPPVGTPTYFNPAPMDASVQPAPTPAPAPVQPTYNPPPQAPMCGPSNIPGFGTCGPGEKASPIYAQGQLIGEHCDPC